MEKKRPMQTQNNAMGIKWSSERHMLPPVDDRLCPIISGSHPCSHISFFYQLVACLSPHFQVQVHLLCWSADIFHDGFDSVTCCTWMGSYYIGNKPIFWQLRGVGACLLVVNVIVKGKHWSCSSLKRLGHCQGKPRLLLALCNIHHISVRLAIACAASICSWVVDVDIE